MSAIDYIVFYLAIFNIFHQTYGLVEIPKDEEDNGILKTESTIRLTVNQIFKCLKLKGAKNQKKIKEFTLIHNYFVSLTLEDYSSLQHIARLSRVDKTIIRNETAHYMALLNEIFDDSIEHKEYLVNSEYVPGIITSYLDDTVQYLEKLKAFNGNDTNSRINDDILSLLTAKAAELNITQETDDDYGDDDLVNENEFWVPPKGWESRRIFNGKNVKIRKFPFVAAILIFKQFHCAGSIIHNDLVLTAASCIQLAWNNRFFRENPAFLSVRVGSTFYSAGGEEIAVLEAYFHPSYEPKTLVNNLAIMRLVRKINFKKARKKVKKIKLDTKDHALPMNVDGIITLGWGAKTRSNIVGDPWSNRLSYAVLDPYPFSDCRDTYSKQYVRKTNFCAGFISHGGGACNRDVGGPGLLEGILVGVISFGSPLCGTPDAPTVFTKVGYYYDWIEEIMEQEPIVPHQELETTLMPEREPTIHTSRSTTRFTINIFELGKIDARINTPATVPDLRFNEILNTPATTLDPIFNENLNLFQDYLKTVFVNDEDKKTVEEIKDLLVKDNLLRQHLLPKQYASTNNGQWSQKVFTKGTKTNFLKRKPSNTIKPLAPFMFQPELATTGLVVTRPQQKYTLMVEPKYANTPTRSTETTTSYQLDSIESIEDSKPHTVISFEEDPVTKSKLRPTPPVYKHKKANKIQPQLPKYVKYVKTINTIKRQTKTYRIKKLKKIKRTKRKPIPKHTDDEKEQTRQRVEKEIFDILNKLDVENIIKNTLNLMISHNATSLHSKFRKQLRYLDQIVVALINASDINEEKKVTRFYKEDFDTNSRVNENNDSQVFTQDNEVFDPNSSHDTSVYNENDIDVRKSNSLTLNVLENEEDSFKNQQLTNIFRSNDNNAIMYPNYKKSTLNDIESNINKIRNTSLTPYYPSYAMVKSNVNNRDAKVKQLIYIPYKSYDAMNNIQIPMKSINNKPSEDRTQDYFMSMFEFLPRKSNESILSYLKNTSELNNTSQYDVFKMDLSSSNYSQKQNQYEKLLYEKNNDIKSKITTPEDINNTKTTRQAVSKKWRYKLKKKRKKKQPLSQLSKIDKEQILNLFRNAAGNEYEYSFVSTPGPNVQLSEMEKFMLIPKQPEYPSEIEKFLFGPDQIAEQNEKEELISFPNKAQQRSEIETILSIPKNTPLTIKINNLMLTDKHIQQNNDMASHNAKDKTFVTSENSLKNIKNLIIIPMLQKNEFQTIKPAPQNIDVDESYPMSADDDFKNFLSQQESAIDNFLSKLNLNQETENISSTTSQTPLYPKTDDEAEISFFPINNFKNIEPEISLLRTASSKNTRTENIIDYKDIALYLRAKDLFASSESTTTEPSTMSYMARKEETTEFNLNDIYPSNEKIIALISEVIDEAS